MPLGLHRRSMELLEWLYNHPGEPLPADFFGSAPGDTDELRQVVSDLDDQGLVDDQTTFGGVDGVLRPRGRAVVEQLRAARATPEQRHRRATQVQTHILWWLDEQEIPPASVAGALDSIGVDQFGTPFTIGDVNRAATYLCEIGMIRAHKSWQSDFLRPQLTSTGRTCLTEFGGNVSDYNAAHRPGTTNHITVSGPGNNVAVGDHNVQNMTTGLDTTKVLEFVNFVSQAMPVLGLPDDEQGRLRADIEDLRRETEEAPEPGRIKAMITAVLTKLGSVATTALGTTAITLGEQAIDTVQKAITGG